MTITCFHSVVKRLLIPPAVAALAVLILAAGTLLDILTARKLAGEKAAPERAAPSPAPKRVSMAENIPALTDKEALQLIETSPTKAAIMTLWPKAAHRDRLLKVLLAKVKERDHWLQKKIMRRSFRGLSRAQPAQGRRGTPLETASRTGIRSPGGSAPERTGGTESACLLNFGTIGMGRRL